MSKRPKRRGNANCDDDDDDVESLSQEECKLCNQTYDGVRFMLSCHRCESFYHGECVGVSTDQAKKLRKFRQSYVCKFCVKKRKSSDNENSLAVAPVVKCKICCGKCSSIQPVVTCGKCKSSCHSSCIRLKKHDERLGKSYICKTCCNATNNFGVS